MKIKKSIYFILFLALCILCVYFEMWWGFICLILGGLLLVFFGF